MYTSQPNAALRLDVSRYADSLEWTLFHEIGHLLDHLALNPQKRLFASEHDPRFNEVASFWMASRPVQSLNALLRSRRNVLDPHSRMLVRSYLSSRELWARTYAQWVAVRWPHEGMRKHLRHLQAKGDWVAGIHFATQWEDIEFRDIMTCVDEIFEAAGFL